MYTEWCANSTITCDHLSPDEAVIPEYYKCNDPTAVFVACIATVCQLCFIGLEMMWSKDAIRANAQLQPDGTEKIVEEPIPFHIGFVMSGLWRDWWSNRQCVQWQTAVIPLWFIFAIPQMVPLSLWEFYGALVPVATLYFTAAFCGDVGNSLGNKTPYHLSKIAKEKKRHFGDDEKSIQMQRLNMLNDEVRKRVHIELLEDRKFLTIEVIVIALSALLVVYTMTLSFPKHNTTLHYAMLLLAFLMVIQMRSLEYWWCYECVSRPYMVRSVYQTSIVISSNYAVLLPFSVRRSPSGQLLREPLSDCFYGPAARF